MLYIDKVTADPQQQMNLTGIQGITIGLKLRYMPRIQRWISNISYNNVNINGVAITTAPNFLRQYRNM